MAKHLASFSLLILLALPLSVAAEPRQVLLLHSFERDFPGHDFFAANFRAELGKKSPVPVSFYEISVQLSRSDDTPEDEPILNYMHAMFANRRLDLVVPIGGPAVKFAQKNRQKLFPAIPMLFSDFDQRFVDMAAIRPNDAIVGVSSDPSLVIDTILQTLPQTENVFVVVGNSQLENFWRGEIVREFQRFKGRLTFVWSNELSVEEILKRSAALPPNSVIYYQLLSVDAKGVAQSEARLLSDLHAVANAPIFGQQGYQLGQGIVGGPLLAIDDLSRNTASVALRIMDGESPEHLRLAPQLPGPQVFDWRELRRWGISEDRLPPGNIVQFRELTVWARYKWQIIAALSVFLLEALLILALIANLFKRRSAERSLSESIRAHKRDQESLQRSHAELERRTLQLRRLASQLTLAEQSARKQLASTLHDGLQQLLFSASMTLDRLVKANSRVDQVGLLQRASDDVREAMQAARTLSVNLFPPVLHLGGLPVALSWLAQRTQEQYSTVVNVSADPLANPEPSDLRFLLFEVVRELLFNAVKHAHVDRVDVKLAVGPGDTLHIEVSDEGIGFDPIATLQHEDQHQVGLGLFSIQERLASLGGHLEVRSAPGKGARFTVTLPRAGPSRLATDGAEAQRPDTRRKEHIVYEPGTAMLKSLRILIADDHAVARAGLRELFSKAPFQVVGEAANGVEAISQAMALQPDVIIMDVSMPQMNGIEATREIHRVLPHIQVVGLSTHDDENIQRSMREAGADAYFTKNEGTDRLFDYLLSLHAQAKGA